MIQFIEQNLIDMEADVIAHQCNCQGVMGAGVARQVKEWLLMGTGHYRAYQKLCQEQGGKLLGKVQWCPLPDGRRTANIFGQDRYGRDKCYTDYEAVKKGLMNIERNCREHGLATAAIPDHMGCSLGGGDWGYMLEQVIKPVFQDSPVTLYICRMPGYGM